MDNVQKSRARLLINHIFFATLLLSTKAVEDRTVPTAYTTGKKIGYNPDFFAALTVAVCEFVWAHEVCHDMLEHGFRRNGRNPLRWNHACDYAVNQILKDSGFTLWERCLIDERFKGMHAEKIYDILDKEDQEERKRRKQSGQGGDPTEDRDGNSPMSGDIKSEENASPEERSRIQQEIRQRVGQAASMARMAGQLSGGLARLVDEILNPQVDWDDQLREFMTRLVHDDESWTRRNRRFRHIYLPARHSVQLGEVIYIGDTSGSISNKELAQVASEAGYIASELNPERIRMIWADTKVAGEQIFEEGEQIEPDPKGGGGTDMRVPLLHVEQFDPQVVILHTDGFTPWPTEAPPYPLIVVCTTDQPIPFGNVVRITP